MADEPWIIPISDDPETYAEMLLAVSDLHKTFRPDLPADYVSYMRKMFADGAEMTVLDTDNNIKSLVVYRCYYTTFHSLRFYIDDLVTSEAERGQRFGHKILAWCEERARGPGCDTLT